MTQIIINGLILFGVAVLFGFGVKLGAAVFERLAAMVRRAEPPRQPTKYYVGDLGAEVVKIMRRSEARRL